MVPNSGKRHRTHGLGSSIACNALIVPEKIVIGMVYSEYLLHILVISLIDLMLVPVLIFPAARGVSRVPLHQAVQAAGAAVCRFR